MKIEEGQLLKIKEGGELWADITNKETGWPEDEIRQTLWTPLGIDRENDEIEVQKVNNCTGVALEDYAVASEEDFVAYEGTPGDVAVKLDDGSVIAPQAIARVESSQWNLEDSNNLHHIVATDKDGNEIYVVKEDRLFKDVADDAALAIEDVASSDDATYAYLYSQVNDMVYGYYVLNRFKYICV